MKTWVARAVATFAFVALIVLARENWAYLQAGYHIRIGFEGGPLTEYDESFPLWRKLTGLALFVVVATGALLAIFVRPSAVLVLGVGMVGTLVLGLYDVWWYGTISSPTSLLGVAFVVAMFAVAVSAKQAGILR